MNTITWLVFSPICHAKIWKYKKIIYTKYAEHLLFLMTLEGYTKFILIEILFNHTIILFIRKKEWEKVNFRHQEVNLKAQYHIFQRFF